MKFELAYQYKARSSRQTVVSGTVFGCNQDQAFASLQRCGLRPVSLKTALWKTLNNLRASGFDEKNLIRFYRTLGRRLSGRSAGTLTDCLHACGEFIRDDRLKQAALMMLQGIRDGKDESTAMLAAGFPKRDAMVVKAAAQSGSIGEAFTSLSTELERSSQMRASMTRIWRMPVMLISIVYGLTYIALITLMPQSAKFMKEMGIGESAPDFAKWVNAFTEIFNAHLTVATLIYLLLPVLVVLFIRSERFIGLVDRLAWVREISVKSDQGALWNGFILLYDAGVVGMEATHILRDAAKRADSKKMFTRLGLLLQGGFSYEEAVSKANFPTFVIDGVRAGMTSNHLTQELADMTRGLSLDVADRTQQLTEIVEIGSKVLAGAAVLGLILITYYPTFGTAIQSLI